MNRLKELNAVYETESSKCAAWVFPYRAFDFRAVGLSKKDPKHLTMAFENKRFKDGIQGEYHRTSTGQYYRHIQGLSPGGCKTL